MKQKRMGIRERIKAPVPRFFRKLRRFGLVLAAGGAAVLSAPVGLPAVVVTVAGYVSLAGGIISAISQATVMEESDE